jgi:hypothetical protein
MFVLVLLVSVINFFFLAVILLQVFGWLTYNVQIPFMNRANKLFNIPTHYTITVDTVDHSSKTFEQNKNEESSESESEEEDFKIENNNGVEDDSNKQDPIKKEEETENEESDNESVAAKTDNTTEVKSTKVSVFDFKEGLNIRKNKILIDESLD